MAGFSSQANNVNQDAGRYVTAVAVALRDAAAFNTMLLDPDRFNGATGLQANQQFSTSDAGLLIAAFGDLNSLCQVAHAQREQVGVNDFFYNAKKLMGTVPL